MALKRVPVTVNFDSQRPIGYADVDTSTGEASIHIVSGEMAAWLGDKDLKGLSLGAMAIIPKTEEW